MSLFQFKKEREAAINKMDGIVRAAENAKRDLTADENSEFSILRATVDHLSTKIQAIQSKNTLVDQVVKFGPTHLLGGGNGEGRPFTKSQPVTTLSAQYPHAFYEWLQSRGQKIDAALYEGAGSAGGFAVPSMVDGQIVPLAPQEMGVRKLATVIPTAMDIKIPQQASFGTAAAKAESGASTFTFAESDPTLSQFTLSAFMGGITHTVSWAVIQDVPTFQAFAITDMTLALQMYEENLFVNGNGSGQAQGLIGNTGLGTGLGVEPDTNGNLVSINSTFDVMGTLNAEYHPGAAWLMQRATGIELRKAQAQQNLFEPVFTRVGVQDYLHGYPVEYSTSMPVIARGNTPVLFGNFKFGYVIGDRGGSGINVKILDQPLPTQGQVILLAYRRMDGRVRRSEAIQQIKIALS